MNKKYIIRGNALIYQTRKGAFINVPKTQYNYKKILDYLMSADFDEETFIKMANDRVNNIEKESKGKIKLNKEFSEEAAATCGGINIPENILRKIEEMRDKGLEFRHYEKFWDRCLKNPEPRSIEMLFSFLDTHHLTITEDGHFLAYKGIRTDYYDVHSRTFDNSPGKTISMPRENVTYDPNSDCSAGLHAGNLGYARNWGPVVVLVKIDPADVVSVPKHSSAQKIRVCRYTVEQVYSSEKPLANGVVKTDTKKAIQARTIRTKGWSEEEENILRKMVEGVEKPNWKAVSEKICRSVAACRKKWKSVLVKILAEVAKNPKKTSKKKVASTRKELKPYSLKAPYTPLVSKKKIAAEPKKKTVWDAAKVSALCAAVRKHKKDWAAIGTAVGMTPAACRAKWRRMK